MPPANENEKEEFTVSRLSQKRNMHNPLVGGREDLKLLGTMTDIKMKI